MDCVIVGGGIGGLTTAIALRARGIGVRVFEAAPQLREVGAGIWMPANALQVLDRLGVAEAVRDAGRHVFRAEVQDVGGAFIQQVNLEAVARRYGFATVAIHRARLQDILASSFPRELLHTGRELASLEMEEHGTRAVFGDGSEVKAEVLIGADGLRSTVRGQIFPSSSVRYSGQTSYRGIASWRLPPRLEGTGREIWGAGRRFGFSAIAAEEIYWFAVEDAPQGGSDAADETLEQLRQRFSGFPAPVSEILCHTDGRAITRTDICDLRRLRTWSRDRVVLVGDAAHATTPNLGQGGAQAIEDAYVLADRLAAAGGDAVRAFGEYERIRKGKADRTVATSWWLGKLAHLHNPVGRSLRNALLRLTPRRATERQFDSLFRLNY